MITSINEFKVIKLNEASYEQLYNNFIISGKLDIKIFNEIKNNIKKSMYATWLITNIINNNINQNDIYKYFLYFSIFDRYKNKYKFKDINQFKSKDDIKQFIDVSINIEKQEQTNPETIKKINKYEKYNKYLYLETTDYYIYKFNNDFYENNIELNNAYFAACKLINGSHICTSNGKNIDSFKTYTEEHDLYYIINKFNKLLKFVYSWDFNEFKTIKNSQIWNSYTEIPQSLFDTFIIISETDNLEIPKQILNLSISDKFILNRKRITIDDEY